MIDANHIKLEASRLAEEDRSLDSYRTLAEIDKLLTEKEKSDIEINNQRLEWLKTGATAIVPLLTIITLAVTVYFQWAQAVITRRSNEDAQWKTLTETMGRPPGPTVDASVIASLIPLYHSERYQASAYNAILLISRRLVDSGNFKVLYKSTFGIPDWSNVDNTVELLRSVKVGFDGLQESFELNQKYATARPRFAPAPMQPAAAGSILAPQAASQQQPISDIYGPQEVEYVQWRHEQFKQEEFLCNKIGDVLRSSRPWFSPIATDFSDLFLYGGSLDNANLNDINLKGSRIEHVSVSGARIFPKNFSESTWPETAWREASEISPELLNYLMRNFYPNQKSASSESIFATNFTISKDDYYKKVKGLCFKAKIICDENNLPFKQ